MRAEGSKRKGAPAGGTTTRRGAQPSSAAPNDGTVRGRDGGEAAGPSQPGRPNRVATMQDIADAAGVSQSTVSRVLTGATTVVPINPATRERVLEVARQLRYHPNPLARGLRGARTMLLGVIVREITDPFFAGAIDAITTEASRRGYNLVLGHAHGRADEAIALRAVLETRHCDAILLVGDISDQPRLLDDLRDTDVNLVGAWQGTPLPGITTVNVDNRLGMNGVIDHLTGLGHRSIAFVGGRFAGGRTLGDIRERRLAVVARMASLGLEMPDYFQCEAQNSLKGGASAFEDLMAGPQRPTAVVASTDVLALGALHAANRLGLRVPEDVSIAGFDDLPMAEYAVPPLTTVRQPIADMAAIAVRVAIDEPTDRAVLIEHVVMPTLVIRESTGPAPAAH